MILWRQDHHSKSLPPGKLKMSTREANSARGQNLGLYWLTFSLRLVSALVLKLVSHKWFLTLVDQSIVSGTSLLIGIIIGRTCGKEQFGLYTLGISIIGLIIIFQESIIWSPYAVFSPSLSGTASFRYTGSSFLHQVALSVIAMMVLAGAGLYLSGAGVGGGLGAVIWMLLVVSLFITFRGYVRQVFFARLQMKAAAVMDGSVALVLLSGIGLLAYLGKLSVSRAFAVIGVGCALAGMAWVLWARESLIFLIKQAILDLRLNWSLGKWIVGANLVVFLSSQLSVWLLIFFHGTAAVGTFAACQGIVAIANPFLVGSGFFLKAQTAHVFTKDGIDKLRSLVIRSTLVIALGMGLFFVAILVAGDRLLSFVYGTEFGGHHLILAILGLGALVDALEHGIYYGLMAMKKSDLNFKINLLRVAVMLTIGSWLVKTMGLLGAAMGLLLADAAALSTQGWLFVRSFYAAGNFTKPRK
jgi:O-antigen/teichoic acid export membrane protein